MSELTTDELVTLLASAPDQLDAALAAIAPQEFVAAAGGESGASGASGEESWTTSEIVGHLCDAARYWGARMRRAIYEDAPALELFDQDAFVRLAAYRYTPADALAREFRVVNQSNVALLRSLRPEQWQRIGVHAERGPITVRAMVEIETNHEIEHARTVAKGG